jgi:signal peptidase I
MLKSFSFTAISRTLAVLALTLGAVQMNAEAASQKSNISMEKALNEAQKIIATNSNWSVVRGAGESMSPFFSSHSLLLINKSTIDSLKNGMIVVYADESGDLVAHQVVKIDATGVWTKGVNNGSIDPSPVTAKNLAGVVFGTLFTKDNNLNASIPTAYGKTY